MTESSLEFSPPEASIQVSLVFSLAEKDGVVGGPDPSPLFSREARGSYVEAASKCRLAHGPQPEEPGAAKLG